ncbi:DUF1702 family protein [Streptosporangium longisporum]
MMPTVLGSLRRLLLTPSLRDVTFERRGFPVTPSETTRRLEMIPQSVVCGFEWGIDCREPWEVERRVDLVDPELRGFAYEGVTMAFTVLDAMGPGRGTRTRDLLLGAGAPHLFLAYIGIGFAMARLPRPLWSKVVPDIDGSPYHPTMTWLAVDGYGFDRAYFDTRRWIGEQRVPEPYPWAGAPEYFPRAVDQGIGRALWFVHGARPDAVASAVERFASHRRADLWSGAGLAAAFAGGCDAEGLAALRHAAGEYRPELAQGAVFAVKARHHAGPVPAHTETAAAVLADLSVESAAALADAGVAEYGTAAVAGREVPYELWRRRVHAHFRDTARTPR